MCAMLGDNIDRLSFRLTILGINYSKDADWYTVYYCENLKMIVFVNGLNRNDQSSILLFHIYSSIIG